MAETKKSARFAAARWGGQVDADEVQAETLLAIMQRRAALVAAEEAGEEPPVHLDPSSERYLASRISRSVATRTFLQIKSSDNIPGWNKYKAAVDRFCAEHGREPSQLEKDRIAEEVRLSFPAHHRPTIGFHLERLRRPVSLDALMVGVAGDEGDARAPFEPEAPAVSFGGSAFPVNSFGDLAHEAVEERQEAQTLSGMRVAEHKAKALAYSAIAERRGAPVPVANSITEGDATRARKAMVAAGGVVVVARRVAAGDATSVEVRALLAGFPNVPESRADEVADTILAHAAYSEDLWASTLKHATRQNPRKRTQK